MIKPIYISKSQNRRDFDCGEDELNEFIQKSARQNHDDNISKTYVIVDDNNNVIAFYTLVYENIELEELNLIPSDLRACRKNKFPCVLLGMLARDKKIKQQDYGLFLLNEAIKKTYEASKIAGIKGLFLSPINKSVCEKFYDKIDFLTRIDEKLYYIPINTVREIVA